MECRRLRVRCTTAPPRLRKATEELSNERAVEHQRCIRLGCTQSHGRLIGTLFGEASGRSQRMIVHIRVQGIRAIMAGREATSPPVQRVGCVLSRRTRHNGSCLTDSKDDAVQREGGTVVVETQRMKKSRSTFTPAPLLRWIFRRGDRALTCQLERETFDAGVAAFQQHAAIASDLRRRGWTLVVYGAAA